MNIVANELVLDFGCRALVPLRNQKTQGDNITTNDLPNSLGLVSPFHRVQSEMLKRRQRRTLRRRPPQYEKLTHSIQQKIKQPELSNEQQREQLHMLQQCRNYFHTKRNTLYPQPPVPGQRHINKRESHHTNKTESHHINKTESHHINKRKLCANNCQYTSLHYGQSVMLHSADNLVGERLLRLMEVCRQEYDEGSQVKENMQLFGYYCRGLDRRLEKMKSRIERKERII